MLVFPVYQGGEDYRLPVLYEVLYATGFCPFGLEPEALGRLIKSEKGGPCLRCAAKFPYLLYGGVPSVIPKQGQETGRAAVGRVMLPCESLIYGFSVHCP